MPTDRKFPEPQPYANHARPPIPLTPVESSQVHAIGYDETLRTLAVQFKHGARAIYHYPNVAPEFYAAFQRAESIGKFFGQNVKQLPFEKFPAEGEVTA